MSSLILFGLFGNLLRKESFKYWIKMPTDSYLLNALNFHNSLKNSVSEYDNQKLMCLDEENEATHYCLDCQDYFCEGCVKVHQKIKTTIEEMKDEDQINVISSSSQCYCQIHQQKEIDLFCDDSKEPICSLCIDKHPSHKMLSLLSIMKNEKQSLIELINHVRFCFFSFFLFLNPFLIQNKIK